MAGGGVGGGILHDFGLELEWAQAQARRPGSTLQFRRSRGLWLVVNQARKLFRRYYSTQGQFKFCVISWLSRISKTIHGLTYSYQLTQVIQLPKLPWYPGTLRRLKLSADQPSKFKAKKWRLARALGQR